MQETKETWVRSLGWEYPLPEGVHGNPLQYSCLENPMDGGAWQVIVRGVAQSQTQLKRLSELVFHDMFSRFIHFVPCDKIQHFQS